MIRTCPACSVPVALLIWYRKKKLAVLLCMCYNSDHRNCCELIFKRCHGIRKETQFYWLPFWTYILSPHSMVRRKIFLNELELLKNCLCFDKFRGLWSWYCESWYSTWVWSCFARNWCQNTDCKFSFVPGICVPRAASCKSQ